MDSSIDQRKIIHIDCDCFFASVEQLDDPSLIGQPMAVGGDSARSVLTTANYAARAYGVRSAMPTWQAREKCPQLIIRPVRMQRYQEVSQAIMTILRQHCDAFEQVSVDEAYLDVSDYYRPYQSAQALAQHLQQVVEQAVGVTVSAGVSYNKLMAKLASDWRKPGGLTTIAPSKATEFLATLALSKLPGVGPKTAKRLAEQSLHQCQDLWPLAPEALTQYGSFRQRLLDMSVGIDHRPVSSNRQRKSVGIERTFSRDLATLSEISQATVALIPAGLARLKQRPYQRLSVKLKFNDFRQTTVTTRCTQVTDKVVQALVAQAWQRGQRPVRLVGLQFLLGDGPQQLPLDF